MRIPLLILIAAVTPLIWGWTMHRLIAKLWPQTGHGSGKPQHTRRSEPPLDYQI